MKIQSKDLRIGNFVWGVSDRIECISELQRDKVETTFRGHLYNYSLYEDISPIELTPEILDKAGFGNWPNGYWGNGLILTYYQGDLVPQIVDQIINYKPIKYLHQLQNLYHGLTQSELNITL